MNITPFHYAVFQGNALSVLQNLKDVTVHCVVTSPPFFMKRRYGKSKKEIGQQGSVYAYTDSLVEVFNTIPLHPRGSIWVNLGDKRRSDGSLMMIPETFATRMKDSGWLLADNVIWAKAIDQIDGTVIGNCMTEPAPGRLNSNAWESLYRFVQGPKIQDAWTDTCAVRIPRDNVDSIRYLPEELMICNTSIEGRNLHNVWQIPMGQTKRKHYAVFPVELCERPIAMTCPMRVCKETKEPRERIIEMVEYDEGEHRQRRKFGKSNQIGKTYNHNESKTLTGRYDTGKEYIPRKPVTKGWSRVGCKQYKAGIVMDPFCGTGTVGECAIKLGRSFIGIDLYQEFCEETIHRCRETMKKVDKGGIEREHAWNRFN